jgi:hypothetical protein
MRIMETLFLMLAIEEGFLRTPATDLQSDSNFKLEDYGWQALGKKTDALFDLQEFLLLPSQLVCFIRPKTLPRSI